ncbi:hypothetical protein DFQ28_002643 [Apophysomyces sp. BC1034]|nr:hypothetical protein DFQ30_003225 [Apophysomyces sp. BC1015]KAG0179666.1 hypothetical protein DFQ29_001834 [Apophysomyces sp. BC1021]KAG0189977.1 hypothetical protein DFQ28_002643 [Apophysomyces sp. BC1034]
MDSLDTLDTSQREKLEQFQSITHTEDLSESINKLVEHEWDLERAIQHIYDNKAAQSTTRQASPASATPSPPVQPQRTPFPRILSRRPITAPQRQDPRTIAARFLRDFEFTYGETHLDFFQGGYSQALETAKKELRFLLVVLQSDEHDDTDEFCRDTLTSTELIAFLHRHQILVWAGNVREAEAFQVSSTLQATAYPFLAIIALQVPSGTATPSTPKMSVVDRIEGLTSSASITRRLDAALERYGPALNRLRMEQDQRDLERRLRQEQDRAYNESLRADQEKERKAREEREALARAEEEKEQAERERQRHQETREQYIRYIRSHLQPEPAADYQGEVTKISFRLANGERVIRKFRGDDPIEALYQFVEVYPLLHSHESADNTVIPADYHHKYQFTIISPYPRTVYQADSHRLIRDERSLWPSATLIVDSEVDEDD